TGDRYYLEELKFWAEWNLTGTDPVYRGIKQGLVKFDQVREQAWTLRTLAQVEYITPDSDPAKETFRRQLQANIDWFNANFTDNPQANKLHVIPALAYDNGTGMAPWQDDFFTWSIGYVQGLGEVNARGFLLWKAAFPVQRIVAPGFCWILGAP